MEGLDPTSYEKFKLKVNVFLERKNHELPSNNRLKNKVESDMIHGISQELKKLEESLAVISNEE